jgi:hypothetical protein
MLPSKALALSVAVSITARASSELASSDSQYGAIELRSSHIGSVGNWEFLSDVALAPLESGNTAAIATLGSTAVGLTAAVCTAVAGTGPVGVAGCLFQGLVATIGSFFAIFQLSGKRDVTYQVMLDYPAGPGCHGACQLDIQAPEGDWRIVGNATVSGIHHDLYYRRNGTLSGVRAVQRGNATDVRKRSENDVGGLVVDYNWSNDNIVAYDSFGSSPSQIQTDSSFFEQKMVDANVLLACAGWQDSNGILADGLISVGWNDQAFQFEDGEENGLLSECHSDDI